MAPLAPYIDDDGLLRVGGKLSHANIPNFQKHPILLCKCYFVDLLIRNVHLQHGHSGNALTDRILTYIKWKAMSAQQVIAELP
jgi:hypothetical protein